MLKQDQQSTKIKSDFWKKKIINIPSSRQESNCKIRDTVFFLKSSILQNKNKAHSNLMFKILTGEVHTHKTEGWNCDYSIL